MFRKPSVDYLIAGLGNPGPEYERTRHNIGFRALDYLAGTMGAEVKRLKHYALTGKGVLEGRNILLMKPQTYMNDSGRAIADAARYYKIPPERIIILHDDITLPTGTLRIRLDGSPGGHNGLKSIEEHLHSDNYIRFKFGAGSDRHPDYDLKDFVLGSMTPGEFEEISSNFPPMREAIRLLLNGETQKAMSKYNINPRKQTEHADS